MASVLPDRPPVPSAARDAASVAPVGATGTPCRNCGTHAPGRYCGQCGQETTLALPTARQFLKEAAGRYVALDGRMWRTLAALAFRPGFLTRAYFAGQRRRYIRPSRLFLVLSLLMFAVFRIVLDVPRFVDDQALKADDRAPTAAAGEAPAGSAAVGGSGIVLPGFSLRFDDRGNLVAEGEAGAAGIELNRRLQRFNALPRQEKSEQLFLGVMRYGPYAMFVLLPAFALLLFIAYLPRSRRAPSRPRRYAEHLVYAAHSHAFFFLAATIAVAAPLAAVRTLLFGWALIYALWSLKVVYGGSWIGVAARAWLVTIAYVVMFVFVVTGLVLAAIVVR